MKDSRKVLFWFAILALVALVTALVGMIVDIISGEVKQVSQQAMNLVFLGIICLALGFGISNKIELDEITLRNKSHGVEK